MKHIGTAFLLALLLSLSLPSQAAPAPVPVHLPAVRTAPFVPAEPSTCDGSAPLLYKDTGSLSAILTADGHFIVGYQSRSEGSKLILAAHIGAALTTDAPWLDDTVLSQGDKGPALVLTPIKGGSIALVALPGGGGRAYFTQRTPEDAAANAGPYGIWCEEF